MRSSKFNPGDRVRVYITQREDVLEGDEGTVVAVRRASIGDAFYVDVILDTGVRMGNYHEFTFTTGA